MKKASAAMKPTRQRRGSWSRAAHSGECGERLGSRRAVTEPDEGQLEIWRRTLERARRRPVTPRSTTRCASSPTLGRLRLPIITIGLRKPMRRCMKHWTDQITNVTTGALAEP